MLLNWDLESPVRFRTKETVHELDLRFQLEECYLLQGKCITNKQFYKDLHEYIEKGAAAKCKQNYKPLPDKQIWYEKFAWE